MKPNKLLVLFVNCLLMHNSHGLELVNSPEPKMIPQGDSYTLYCETDEPFELCKWSHTESGKECRVTKEDIDEKHATECKDDSHIVWELTETNCGITIQNAARSDIGEYKCTVGVLDPEPTFVSQKVSIDVSVPAIVIFQGNFADQTEVEVKLDTEIEVQCHVTGGYPQPVIQAAIGYEKDHINTESEDQILEVVEEDSIELDDGTFEVTKTFKFLAIEDHCGQYVKCEAVQRDDEDNLLFQEQDVMSRKLSVVYGPLPLHEGELQPFNFTEGDESLQIDIIFKANPIPENNEAIWHINPTGNASHESHVLQAGHSEEDGRYIALPLNNSQVESHGVHATLIIMSPTKDDLENVNYLEVETPKGMQQYHFHLNLLEEPMEETTPEDLVEATKMNDLGSEEDVKGMGVGSVIAIVIVIAVICLIIGCVVYSKRTGKCCFEQPYGPAKQSDHTEDLEQHTNIIKNGGSIDKKLSKSVEAGMDETEKEKQEV